MSWLPNPETIMSGLMKSMGVSVEDFAGFIGTVMTEMRELRADRLAFRPASIKAYQELTARMERMETKLDRAVLMLDAIELKQTNGVSNDERDRDDILLHASGH